MDYAGEATQVRRVPQDDFERELYRQYLQMQTARWYDTDDIHVSIGEVPDEGGAYDLYIYEPHDDPMRVMESKGEIRGKVWLCERKSPASEYYRVVVWHRVGEGRSNTGATGAAPTLGWRVGE